MAPRRRRPRGHIHELPSGSFRAMVYAGTDPLTGKQRYVRETCATYDEAELALTRLQSQVDEDRHPKSGITVGQAVRQWLEVATLEDTTRDRYEDLIRIYIEPTFGDLPAAKLDAELLERFYARLQRCRQLCTGRPYLPAARRQHRTEDPLHLARVDGSCRAVAASRRQQGGVDSRAAARAEHTRSA